MSDQTVAQNVVAPSVAELDPRLTQLLERDPELAGYMPDSAVTTEITGPGLRTVQMLCRILDAYADRPALGERKIEILEDPATGRRSIGYLPEFRSISYRELSERAHALLNVWRAEGEHAAPVGGFVSMLGFASIDYAIADMACILAGVVSVPLQTNMSAETLADTLREVEPHMLLTSLEHLNRSVDAARIVKLKSLVLMDYEPRDDTQRETYEAACAALADSGTAITTFAELVDRGRKLSPVEPHVPAAGEDPLMNIMYTSGSTGTPKGAMFPDSLLSRWWQPAAQNLPIISLHYQPFNHGFGRALLMRTLNQGGLCCFVAKSDMSTLFEDLKIVRPTQFGLVPRVADIIYGHYVDEVARQVAAGGDPETVRAEVRRDMSAHFLGGRLLLSSIASAPTAPEVLKFMRECFSLALIDGYGSTEAGTIALNGKIMRTGIEDYKLRDVPELGYFVTDKPYPRGELVLKTKTAISGYFKHPELTDNLFDSSGYLITGDIVEETAPDQIRYIDRRNNVIKLAQGEFVAIAQLEPLFSNGHPLIRQIYLHGNSAASFLLGVIVPDLDFAREELGHEPSETELRTLVRQAIATVAQTESLRAYEVPRDFIIEPEAFSLDNGLISDMGKYLRPRFKDRYGDALQALYDEISDRQRAKIDSLRDAGGSASIIEKVQAALEATLGVEDMDESRPRSFAELGGDSLVAVSLSLLLEDAFKVPVPVGVILHPAATQHMLARYVENALNGANAGQADFDAVHGKDPTEIRAADLTIDRFFDFGELVEQDLPMRGKVQNVLLTGANGFLGRFLCLEWLERVAPVGGKVTCLLRAEDEPAARRRLDEAFDTGDAALSRRFRELAEKHLDICVGDLSAPRMGLDEETFRRLANDIDIIVHAAALVNHVISYRQLFEPNVQGTAELIRLALTGRRKSFDYVSSLAAAYSHDGTVVVEEADIRTTRPVCPIGAGYANGYGISKWAGEVLLRDAHERFGLPVNVYRSDMILAHRAYSGQINVPDMFTRLLYSLVQVGVAPGSFYELGADGKRVRAHYNGLPVDFIARSMAAIGGDRGAGYATYHIENPHDDGVSLDQMVDWMIDEGYPLTRVADYGQWIDQFEKLMNALPEKRRRQSSIAIISQLRKPASAEGAAVHCEHFRAKVRQLVTDQSGDIPGLSRDFVKKCLDDMVALGMIDPPNAVRREADQAAE